MNTTGRTTPSASACRVARAVGLRGCAARRRRRGGVDERESVVVGAERGAGEREPPRGGFERLPHRLAPRPRIARVVHLVEHDERPPALRAGPVQQRVGRDARVRDGDAAVIGEGGAGRVAEIRVDRDAAAAAASDHCVEVLGRVTTVIVSMTRSASSCGATRANAVLPAPGVAMTRKSAGPRRVAPMRCAARPAADVLDEGRLVGLRHSTPCMLADADPGPRGGDQITRASRSLRSGGRILLVVFLTACAAAINSPRDRGRPPRPVTSTDAEAVEVTVRGRRLRVAVRLASRPGPHAPAAAHERHRRAPGGAGAARRPPPPDLEVIRFDVPGVGGSPRAGPALPLRDARLARRRAAARVWARRSTCWASRGAAAWRSSSR